VQDDDSGIVSSHDSGGWRRLLCVPAGRACVPGSRLYYRICDLIGDGGKIRFTITWANPAYLPAGPVAAPGRSFSNGKVAMGSTFDAYSERSRDSCCEIPFASPNTQKGSES